MYSIQNGKETWLLARLLFPLISFFDDTAGKKAGPEKLGRDDLGIFYSTAVVLSSPWVPRYDTATEHRKRYGFSGVYSVRIVA